jgi:uncharacterized protein (TIGR02594 family)
MQSSVNVNGSNDLAKKYILQGGTLSEKGNKKIGVGTFQNAYSTRAADGTKYLRGIRPMPGITNIDVKSKSAYGSLREVVVNFQCWDIQQLEDLEVLYMRPGYTVLVEWGWAPFIDNDFTYQPTFTEYYDIINKPQTDRTTLFEDLFRKSVNFGGNYDAMFGYVKNYQWSARPDGGYDCQTTIISTGEIIESLKINYISPIAVKTNADGILKDEFSGNGTGTQWLGAYQKNILAGMWSEFYYKWIDSSVGLIKGDNGTTNSAINYAANVFSATNIYLTTTNPNPDSLVGTTGHQVYITLDTVIKLLNKYIIAKSGTDSQPLVELSLMSNNYDADNPSSDLLCIAHPLQISVDPSICLIKSPIWYENGSAAVIAPAAQASQEDPNVAKIQSVYDDIKKGWNRRGTNSTDLLKGIKGITDVNILSAMDELFKNDPDAKDQNYDSFEKMLNGELGYLDIDLAKNIQSSLKTYGIEMKYEVSGVAILDEFGIGSPDTVSNISIPPPATKSVNTAGVSEITIQQNAQQAISNLQFLKDISYNYFYGNERGFDEIGTIKNIYVNVDYLYLKAIDSNIESSDPNGKNEINLFNYLKRIISDIQISIGNVNNFEIHVDPVSNNVARIIDVNYTEPKKASYKKLFELQVHNINSVVRSYSFQSQIFPNQSAAIAIGSQAKGGQLGMQNNTMIDFNRNLTDRIIVEKVDGVKNPNSSVQDNKPTVTNGLAAIVSLYASINSTDTKTNYGDLASKAKNSLRDVIAYFQTICKSPGSNRNIIPTKFSCEMDGIGGLIIGHMFKLPEYIIPRGYRGEGTGVEVGQAITSISHTIGNGDWITKIDAMNMILNDSTSNISFSSLDLSGISEIIKEAVKNESNTGGGTGSGGGSGLVLKSTPPGNGNWTTLNNTIAEIAASAARGEWKEARSNPNIIAALQSPYTSTPPSMTTTDLTAWCAGFVAYVLKTAGLSYLPNDLWSPDYAGYGTDVGLDRKNWKQWDIVVYNSHVGFIYGASADGKHITTFGGNQGDNVTTSTFPVSSYGLRAVRRYWTPPSEALGLNVGRGQANIKVK